MKKQSLLNLCNVEIEKRINEIQASLRSVQEAKNNETKSSVGDKYETARAMMQIEEERLSMQLEESLKMRIVLGQIDPGSNSKTIVLGSIVAVGQNKYFISVALGKISLENEVYYCISVHSPIGKLLLGKNAGTYFEFNGVMLKIDHIE